MRKTGVPAPPGSFECQVGLSAVLESDAPCGVGNDVTLRISEQCAPLSTETVSTFVNDVNAVVGETMGPDVLTGSPAASCAALAAGDPSQAVLTGNAGALDGTTGDQSVPLRHTCQ